MKYLVLESIEEGVVDLLVLLKHNTGHNTRQGTKPLTRSGLVAAHCRTAARRRRRRQRPWSVVVTAPPSKRERERERQRSADEKKRF